MTDWRDRAACRTADPELFFPDPTAGGGAAQKRYKQAKAICATCPVVAECLSWALTAAPAGMDYGVWGGLAPDERRALRRHLKQQPTAAA